MRSLFGTIFLSFLGSGLLSILVFGVTQTGPASNSSSPGLWPFAIWTLGGSALLGYVVASSLVWPLRRLKQTVEQFGRGDLSARTGSLRKDEVGGLSRAFDRMAERIETLLTAERRLLQDVSHELRSPLARLRFAVELARADTDRQEPLGQIARDVERLAKLVDELLQLTRAEGDPSSQNLHILSLNELLQSLVTDCLLEAEGKGRDVSLEATRFVQVIGERELLRRAFENVLRNAIHYTPEGTAVKVRVSVADHQVMVTIRDQGPGIPDEALDLIFKPFFRVDGDRARASGGVGLGLSIAQRAISLHQGQLVARNASPGLIVTITLPLATRDSLVTF